MRLNNERDVRRLINERLNEKHDVVTRTSSFTLSDQIQYLLGDASAGPCTFTLPTAINRKHKTFLIKRINSGGNNVIIAPQSGETIDGLSRKTLGAQNDFVEVFSNNENWWIGGQ